MSNNKEYAIFIASLERKISGSKTESVKLIFRDVKNNAIHECQLTNETIRSAIFFLKLQDILKDDQKEFKELKEYKNYDSNVEYYNEHFLGKNEICSLVTETTFKVI